MEEAGIEIANVRFVAATNDVSREWGTHYVTLTLVADYVSGIVTVREPHKCETWEWFDWENFPEPLFLPVSTLRATDFHPLHV